jgi:hypothetical protein
MNSELDHGIRCDNHVGEAFPPRCLDCEAEARKALGIPRAGFIPGSECVAHPAYPLPRARCARDSIAPSTPETRRRVLA